MLATVTLSAVAVVATSIAGHVLVAAGPVPHHRMVVPSSTRRSGATVVHWTPSPRVRARRP
jgi:hypothetical protein